MRAWYFIFIDEKDFILEIISAEAKYEGIIEKRMEELKFMHESA